MRAKEALNILEPLLLRARKAPLPQQIQIENAEQTEAIETALETLRRAAAHDAAPERQRSGQRWTAEHDQELLNGFDGGLAVDTLAEKLGRSRSSIASRLVKLGRLREGDEF